MAVFKCKMCGGDLAVEEGLNVCECKFCGTKQTLPNADNEKKINLFNRANRLRFNSEFDKAATIYENIIAEFPEEAEGYWGLVLCNYGIEYVDDPATARKIPTCHRAAFESVTKDENYELALEYADITAQKVYRDEAREIDRIMAEILSISKNEEPYDIFICYKETDEYGERTIDSVIAQDIYDAFIDKGYRVFFSRISLEDKLGQQYEPYIFAALNSAKVMIALGTKYEYFHAVWVKNEWSRFLKLTAKDKTKALVPCYKDMDPYDMPDEFKALQAQDMGKVGALQDLLRGVEKILGAAKVQKEVVTVKETEAVVAGASATVTSLLKRVFYFLEDGDFESADEYCEKILDIDPENARAYLGKLMVELKVKKQDDLGKQTKHFTKKMSYLKLIRFADEDLKNVVYGYVDGVNKCIENENRSAEENQRKLGARRKISARISSRISNYGYLLNGITVAVTTDGKVRIVGKKAHRYTIGSWSNITGISVDSSHIVGVRADGTVVADGRNSEGQCNVSKWTNVIAVDTGRRFTIGLRADGTVIARGLNNNKQCETRSWRNIVDISAGYEHTAGLMSDGRVVATGDNTFGQCNVSGWSDIVDVSAGNGFTLGLRSNGTVVHTGNQGDIKKEVSKWTGIVAISSGDTHTVGLKADGTVVAAGANTSGRCNVGDMRDIVAVSAGTYNTFGIKSNGIVVGVGDYQSDLNIVNTWKVFDNMQIVEKFFR